MTEIIIKANETYRTSLTKRRLWELKGDWTYFSGSWGISIYRSDTGSISGIQSTDDAIHLDTRSLLWKLKNDLVEVINGRDA